MTVLTELPTYPTTCMSVAGKYYLDTRGDDATVNGLWQVMAQAYMAEQKEKTGEGVDTTY